MGHTSKWQFHTEGSHFWRQMVIIDYDGVSTHLMIILMIEFGILVIRASGNFVRSGLENICGATCISGANYFKS